MWFGQTTIIVMAGMTFNGNNNDFALARYNADGSLDTTFGSGGKVNLKENLGRDPVWDVRVGTGGLLRNAFTVTR